MVIARRQALCAVIQNTDQHSADYKSVSHLARPGHADYTGYVRYNGSNDLRGGGHFSGRITAPLVFAGAIASQILVPRDNHRGDILSIMDAGDERFDPVTVNAEQLKQVRSRYLPLINTGVEQQMRDVIARCGRQKPDSGRNYRIRGGRTSCRHRLTCCSTASKTGFAKRYSGVPAVKGIEFGQA